MASRHEDKAEAENADYRTAHGFAGAAMAGAVADAGSGADSVAEDELVRATAAGAHPVTLDDAICAKPLRGNLRATEALYVRGAPDVLNAAGIAMVGTRHPTPYGRVWQKGWPATSPRVVSSY